MISWRKPGMRTVLDTNVVVSALLFRGTASKVHRLVLEGRIEPLVSDAILDEYRRVLAYAKFGLSEADVAWLMDEEIRPWFTMTPVPKSAGSWIPEDPADDRFIALASAVPGAVLVSGDRRILARRTTLPCPVMTVEELLASIGE